MYKSLANPHEFAINHRIFPLPNGINHRPQKHDDIEMIAIDSINYTSLKDLMPESPPPTPPSPFCRGDSWREIPIKDPLLQHAAWAYLQPMTVAERRSDDRRWRRRFHHKFCWLLSCFNGVVLVVLQDWFPERVRERLMIKI